MPNKNGWNQTQPHWDKFLSDIRAARAAVGATYAGAWFHGQQDSWSLLPSLFRYYKDLISELNDAENVVKIFERKVQKFTEYLKRANILEDDDIVRSLRRQLKSKKISKFDLKIGSLRMVTFQAKVVRSLNSDSEQHVITSPPSRS